jgi:hypothetical protein
MGLVEQSILFFGCHFDLNCKFLLVLLRLLFLFGMFDLAENSIFRALKEMQLSWKVFRMVDGGEGN